MSSDLQALLAAIAADPGDDTARLAYADCLQEHGNDARASFIRLQVGAERLHLYSNARAALEERALALFERHWIEWWDEVCVAVGLKRPMPEPKGRLARFALRAGVRPPPGNPYCATRAIRPSADLSPGLSVTQATFDHAARNRYFGAAAFCRGFPDTLLVGPGPVEGPPESRPLVSGWARVAPLDDVCADESHLGAPGPHLAGVRSLFVTSATHAGLGAWLRSPHLPRLVSLDFSPLASGGAPRDWFRLLSTPTAARLERLALRGWLPPPGDFARADLPALRTLLIDAEGPQLLRELTNSRFAAQIEELDLSGRFVPDVFRSLGSGNWTALRRLSIRPYRPYDSIGGLVPLGFAPDGDALAVLLAADLPALEDLHVAELLASSPALDAMAASPLLKRLKHFRCSGLSREYLPEELVPMYTLADLRRLAEAFEPRRLETLTLGGLLPTEPAAEALRAKFGERVRFLT